MSLHDVEINFKLEGEKKLPINSVWFWGCGKLPSIIDRTWSSVYGDEVISEGLSIISATPFKKLPEKFDEIEDINSNF